ncbi:GAF and ANTAR domain-containing protein [Mycobacterium terramassiliense]|uniref:Histidine kinase n=1 Tax=Mycobacterium terramassiliense TaxID=1841859 RepID=A0A2U3N5E2_9MYCO|nr:GAF and ANTAR domain-containing protein [Mycobacterium terramassiliense]SPM26735.1 histidine kinase [Mycobacterium terramassiliense]
MALTAGDAPTAATLSLGARLSRTTIHLAITALEQRHGLDERVAFEVLRDVSQRRNVKLRAVAAELLSPSSDGRSGPAAPPPPLPFTIGGRACSNRSEVLVQLMRAAVTRCGAERGTVQLRDPVHGGLQIEGKRGFGQDFVDAFSYLDEPGTACGHAFDDARQVVVADVDSSPLFSESAREILRAHEVRSCVSTPIVDADGKVRGIVSTHRRERDAVPDEADLHHVRMLANQCGRWLQWYDAAVLPAIVGEVHQAAAAQAKRAGARRAADRVEPAVTIAAAARLLSDRYGVEPSHAEAVLASLAAQRGVVLEELAAQLIG